MSQAKKTSDEILKELFNSINDIAQSSDEDGSDVEKKVVVKKEKKSKSSYDSSYCSKSKHKKKKKSKKSSTKYSLRISSGSDKPKKSSSDKTSVFKAEPGSSVKVEKSHKSRGEKELPLIEVLKKEVIECSVINPPVDSTPLSSIELPPLPPIGNVAIKQEPSDSPKKKLTKDEKDSETTGPIISVAKDEHTPGSLGPSVSSLTKDESQDSMSGASGPKELEIAKVADVFVEDLLDSGDTTQRTTLEKPKRTIQIQNLKNSSILEDAARQKAKSAESKSKKKKIQEEGELSDFLSNLSSSNDDEPDSTDDGTEKSNTISSRLADGVKIEKRPSTKESGKDKSRKKKKKKHKHEHKERRGEDDKASRRRSEHKSKRSKDDVDRKSKRESRDQSTISDIMHGSSSRHLDRSRHRDFRHSSRSKSRSFDHTRKHSRSRSRSPRDHSSKRNVPRDPDDLRSKLKRRRSSDRSHESRSSTSRSDRNKGSPDRNKPRHDKDEYFIDKGKLLEIARKNALSMLKQGQVGTDMNKVVHITAGGKTVDELTDFCKHLSRKEASGMESVSSDSSSDENEKPFHHPFKLKERPSQIIMNIRNCVPLPVKTHQEKATENLRLQFPVSSGQHHRKTESEWVPVSPKRTETKTSASNSKSKDSNAPLPIEAPPPVSAGPVVPHYSTVYPTPAERRGVDIGAVISERLAAIRNEQDATTSSPVFRTGQGGWNPTSGLFTGSTGAKLLTPTELASGSQAWARKDQLMSATPVSGGMGMSLLQKMGWKPGEGLGKNHEGSLEPLKLPVKMDKKGLVCAEEMNWRQRQQMGRIGPVRPTVPIHKSLEGKHPVSLLNEFCTRRRYNPPEFHTVLEDGPPHQKRFIIKVTVNNVAYQPSISSSTKKLAKSEAAKVCLRTLGVLPNS